MTNENTTIKISKEVQKDLKELKHGNESYSAIIKRLLNEHDENEMKLRAYETILNHQWILPNPLTLSGVENLLGRNMVNEVPNILRMIAPSIVEFGLLADKEIKNYSDDEMKLFVEKSEMLINNIQEMMKIFFDNVNENSSQNAKDLKFSLNIYCGYLATRIGKEDNYSMLI